jgi:galactose-6-phosphate isomerase
MNMTIGLIANKKYHSYLLKVQKVITSLKHKAIIIGDGKNVLDDCEALIGAIQSGKVDRGIAIDDYGTVPFMYIAKTKSIVVAQIADEHSAHMTCAHNNATVLSFGGEISTLHQIENMVKSFVLSKYEGGRHKVRIDMLDTLLGGQ